MASNGRQYSADFKAKIVLQALSGKKTVSDVCRIHKLNANVVNRWCKEFLEQEPSIFEHGDRHSEEEQKIAELERLVGQLTVQLKIAKKSIDQFEPEQKREVVMQLNQEHPMATVCQVLNYPRGGHRFVFFSPLALKPLLCEGLKKSRILVSLDKFYSSRSRRTTSEVDYDWPVRPVRSK